jgi:hypothetical protein
MPSPSKEDTMNPAKHPRLRWLSLAAAIVAAGTSAAALASSHREAPFITTAPKVDGTDLYMFMSYEAGRDGYVTLIANYQPLQAPYGGPNYFKMDPNALYEIHVDNNGDAKEDISFQFRFQNKLNSIALPVGGKNIAIPLTQAGRVTDPRSPALNVTETYSVDVVRGDRRSGARAALTNATGGAKVFDKPVDNIGTKTIPDYAGYAAKHLYTVNVPGCNMPARLFVGQRKEAFAVNLGTIFDLVNAPVSVITDATLINAAPNTLDDANVTSLALEVHKSCLMQGNEPVIGAWTTASLRQGSLLDPTPKKGHQTTAISGGAWTQVSRLGMPLVNEVVIGLPDKDRFNGSKPKDDGQFADYVTNPTLPALIEIALALPGAAPTNFPRADLVTTFLTGIPGVNQPANVVRAAEPAGHRRQRVVRGQRLRRLPERPPPEGRRGRHLARGGDGRLVHGQRRQQRLRLRCRVQALGRTSEGDHLQAARRGGPGGGAAAAGLPVPQHAGAGRAVKEPSMKTRISLSMGIAALLLAACGGGGGDTAAPVTDAVPDEASASEMGMAGWLGQVAVTAPEDKEPLDVARFLPPQSEDTEPVALK